MFKHFRVPVRMIFALLILLFIGLASGEARAASQTPDAIGASSAGALTWPGGMTPVGAAPTFRVTPGAINLTIPPGHMPGPQTLQVSNSGSAQLHWRLIAPRLNWLQVTPQSAAGAISSGGPAQRVTLRFRNLVAARTYTTVLVFLDVNRRLAARVPVTVQTAAQINQISRVMLFPLPQVGGSPTEITPGPDGNLWFTDTAFGQIGRITPRGVITEFPLPTAQSDPLGITAGPDGNLWFTEGTNDRIGRMTPQGSVTEFPLPTAMSFPGEITAGPDGNLWFTETDGNQIGRITPSGVISEFPVPTANSGLVAITAGPDGNLWFIENSGNKIGQITPQGSITEFPLPGAGSFPRGITAGPDGNIWFTEFGRENQIGQITPAGKIMEFPVPTPESGLQAITAGPDGNVWFTEEFGNKFGRITPAGAITEFRAPVTNDGLESITAGPDGNLWFTETGSVGRFVLSVKNTCPPLC